MTKQDILEKIEILFYSKSFKEISMQDIANNLWIKKASIYYYFHSKEDIIIEVINYSYEKYNLFIDDLIKQNIEIFIEKFIYFASKENNLFAIINQNWYCENNELKNTIEEKQKTIFKKINFFLNTKYNFSKEKTFLFISLLQDLSKNKCIFGECMFDMKNLTTEIKKIFIS